MARWLVPRGEQSSLDTIALVSGQPEAGDLVYNTTTESLQIGNGTAYVSVLNESEVVTSLIADDAVTYDKIQNVPGLSVIANQGTLEGSVSPIAVAANQVLTANATGTALVSSVITTNHIADDAVTFGKLENLGGNTILANSGANPGSVDDITIDQDRVVGRPGNGAIQGTQVVTNMIADDAVTFDKLVNVPAVSVVANTTNAAGSARTLPVAANQVLSGNAAGTALVSSAITTDHIVDNNVTFGKIEELDANSVMVNDSNGEASPNDLQIQASNVLGRTSSGSLISTQVRTDMIADNEVDFTKFTQLTRQTMVGNNTGATADAREMDATAVRSFLGLVAGDGGSFETEARGAISVADTDGVAGLTYNSSGVLAHADTSPTNIGTVTTSITAGDPDIDNDNGSAEILSGATVDNLGHMTALPKKSIVSSRGNIITASGTNIDIETKVAQTVASGATADAIRHAQGGIAFDSADFDITNGIVTIDAHAVGLGEIQQVGEGLILGRQAAAGTGIAQQLTAAQVRTAIEFDEAAQDAIGAAFMNGEHNGITVTYNDVGLGHPEIELNVNDPVIALTGDATGSATMTNLGDVSIATTISDAEIHSRFTQGNGISINNGQISVTASHASETQVFTSDAGRNAARMVGGESATWTQGDIAVVRGGTESHAYIYVGVNDNAAATDDDDWVELSFTSGENTTYAFTSGTNGGYTVTPSVGDAVGNAQTVNVGHVNIGAATSSTNNLGQVVGNVTVDGNGHVTGLGRTTITPALIGAEPAIDASNRVNATEVGTGIISNTEFNYLNGVTSGIQGQLNAKANIASPTFTGSPKAPTTASSDNSTNIATTAFVRSLGFTGNTGDITAVTVGTGLDGGGTSGSVNIALDLSEFTDMTAAVDGTNDELILLDSGAERRKRIGEINLGQFNNDQGWTSNTGDITNVTANNGLTGGGASGSVTVSLANNTPLRGNPTAVTQATSDNSTRVATTAYVKNQGYTSNVGDITGVTANNGLQGGGASGSVTVGLNLATANTWTANQTATDWCISSDERLKTDVEDICCALDKVKQMRGVEYTMGERRNVGVIAQEMEEVIPEVVTEDENGYKAVSYANLVGVLIEAVKDLSAQVEELKNGTSK